MARRLQIRKLDKSFRPGETRWLVSDQDDNWVGLITKERDTRLDLNPYKVYRYLAGEGSQDKFLGSLYHKDPQDGSILYKPKEALQKAMAVIDGRATLPRMAADG